MAPKVIESIESFVGCRALIVSRIWASLKRRAPQSVARGLLVLSREGWGEGGRTGVVNHHHLREPEDVIDSQDIV